MLITGLLKRLINNVLEYLLGKQCILFISKTWSKVLKERSSGKSWRSKRSTTTSKKSIIGRNRKTTENERYIWLYSIVNNR